MLKIFISKNVLKSENSLSIFFLYNRISKTMRSYVLSMQLMGPFFTN